MNERTILYGDSQPADDPPAETESINTTGLRALVRRLRHASDGGAFPLSLASDAAEAVEQMQDALAGAAAIAHIAGLEFQSSRLKKALNEMYFACRHGRVPTRTADDLAEAEVARLRLLNEKLVEAEQWVLQRRDQCLSDYFNAGGVNAEHDGNLWEDVETEVEVTCVLRQDHPDFREEDDNVVAVLHWLDGIYDGSTGITNWNKFQFRDGHRLQHDHHCYLFHDLTDHVLHGDFDRALDIGGIWIDVQLIQQRGVYW